MSDPYAPAIAELERELAVTQALLEQLRQRAGAGYVATGTDPQHKVEPPPATKATQKRRARPAQKKTDDAAEARKAKSREWMRKKRAAAKAAQAAAEAEAPAMPTEPPPPGWYTDEFGNRCRQLSAEPVHPLTGTSPQGAVRRRGNADATV